ncbi:MAG: DUF6851 domain-containing protein [Gammaproteobacteria bacterium]
MRLRPSTAPRAATRALCGAVLLALAQGALADPIDPHENVLLQWNDATLEAIRITHPGPPIVARMLAVVNTCAFDAWAAYDPKARGTRFGHRFKVPPARRTDDEKREAIAYAAHRAAVDLFPSEQALFDTLLTSQGYDPAVVSEDLATASGIGLRACREVLDYRHRDGANQLGDLTPGGQPYADWTGYAPVNTPTQVNDVGRWQPLDVGGIAQKFIAPHWGRVKGYAVTDWERQVLRPAQQELKRRNGRLGPYKPDEPGFREQAREIIAYGAALNDQQKVIAEYWADGPSSELPPGHWNLFAQRVSARDHHTLDTDVKMMFALSNAVFDTSIAVWGMKVKFDYVRPVTAIRELFLGQTIPSWHGPIQGEHWSPYQAASVVTPPFAEYPSGHSAFSMAGAETLKRFTGSDVFGESVTIPQGQSFVEPGVVPAHPLTLSWATFTDAADEAGISRRYGGIHFLDGDLDSRLMGRIVGELSWAQSRYHFGHAAPPHGGHHGHH